MSKNGFIGVEIRAQAVSRGKQIDLGTFASIEEAIAAREAVELRLNGESLGSAAGRSKTGIKGIIIKANIFIDGMPYLIGTFKTVEEAARAYDSVAIKINRKHRLNFPEEST
jgi:hypothetical protein